MKTRISTFGGRVVELDPKTAHVCEEATHQATPETRSKPMENTTVTTFTRQAASILDASGIDQLLIRWMVEDDYRKPVDPRTTLIGWVATALAGQPLTEEHVTRMLQTTNPVSVDEVRAVTSRLLQTMDYKPLPAGFELSASAFDRVERERTQDAETLARKRARHLEFTQALLTAHLGRVGVSTAAPINVAVSTFFRGTRPQDVAHEDYPHRKPFELAAAEPDAGFLFRKAGRESSFYYGWEYDVATLVAEGPSACADVPNLVVALSSHVPGMTSDSASELIAGTQRNGQSLGQLIADRAYFSMLDATVLRNLSAGGTQVVMAYARDEVGRIIEAKGDAVLLEGRWYHKDIPDHLVSARLDFREASAKNRTPDASRVLSAQTQAELEERLDALLAMRRQYEVEQPMHDLADRTAAWMKAVAKEGVSIPTYSARNTLAQRHHRGWDGAEPQQMLSGQSDGRTELAGEAAQGFVTALQLTAHNARLVAEWEKSRVLDAGTGFIFDEWCTLYGMVESRIKARMAKWSRSVQENEVAAAEKEHGWGGQWVVDHDDLPVDWTPDAQTTVVQVTRADEATADTIAKRLLGRIMNLAEDRLYDCGTSTDLSHEFRIELRFDFIDEYMTDADENPLPMPVGGLPLSADVALVPSSLPRCADMNRVRG